jgi:hypothetical protein
MDLIKRSVLTNKKPMTNFFNALLVNVISMPWMLADTSSSAGQSAPLSLFSALFFQSIRYRSMLGTQSRASGNHKTEPQSRRSG